MQTGANEAVGRLAGGKVEFDDWPRRPKPKILSNVRLNFRIFYPSTGQWRSARLKATHLVTYQVGNLEINALARDLKTRCGDDMKSVPDCMRSRGFIAAKPIRHLARL